MQDQAAIALLDGIHWLPDEAPPPAPGVAEWLMERGSMTIRLETYCPQIIVQRYREGFFPASTLVEEGLLLGHGDRLWLREVVLYGNGQPWLSARTVMLEQSLDGEAQRVMTLGDMPLGRWLFRQQAPVRDFIQFGQIGELWARRSRLNPAGQPLLLTELFLPDSPLYCPARR